MNEHDGSMRRMNAWSKRDINIQIGEKEREKEETDMKTHTHTHTHRLKKSTLAETHSPSQQYNISLHNKTV